MREERVDTSRNFIKKRTNQEVSALLPVLHGIGFERVVIGLS